MPDQETIEAGHSDSLVEQPEDLYPKSRYQEFFEKTFNELRDADTTRSMTAEQYAMETSRLWYQFKLAHEKN